MGQGLGYWSEEGENGSTSKKTEMGKGLPSAGKWKQRELRAMRTGLCRYNVFQSMSAGFSLRSVLA